jgi:hypothetical protein
MTDCLEDRLRRDLPELADSILSRTEAPALESGSEAWGQARPRHQHRRAYAVAAAAVVVALAVSTLALAGRDDGQGSLVDATADAGDDHDLDQPVGLSPVLSPAAPSPEDDRISVAPTGLYTGGQVITITAPRTLLRDAANDRPMICFDWLSSEVCDPTVWASDAQFAPGDEVVSWQRTLPGWVDTPDGLRSCRRVGCRVVIPGADGRRSTPVLDVQPDSAPRLPADLSIAADGSLRLRSSGIPVDDTWATARASSPEAVGSVAPVRLSLCAFVSPLSCDQSRRSLPALPDDGSAFDVIVESSRLLLTSASSNWVDCAQVACMVLVTRTVVDGVSGGSMTGHDEPVAVLPYRLPASTSGATAPALGIEGDLDALRADQPVSVVLSGVPAGVPVDTLTIGQCSVDDLRVADDCRYVRVQPERRADGSYAMSLEVAAATSASGDYLAWRLGGEGAPAAAITARFHIAPAS